MANAARSYLFVPGNRPERFDKARATGADMVIIDLEDAVAPQDKDAARRAVTSWVDAAKPVAVRINAATTEWFDDDLALCGRPGVAVVVLPKTETVDQIAAVAKAAPGAVVVPLIESALGIRDVAALAAAARVQRLAFGTIDFRVDLGMQADDAGDEVELAPFRCQIAVASRLAGLQPPIDGVTVQLDDEARIAADVQRGLRFGFGAKLCIHPKQVALVHRALAPSAQQLDWARRVLAAVAASQGAAVQVDGKMVDKPIIMQAEEILARGSRDDGSKS
jgi:citrate lyase subunit beta/citryl-CoA lyase